MNGFGHGDHYVHIKIRVPTSLTPQQEALIRAFAEFETDTAGTIKGVTKTKSGKWLYSVSVLRYHQCKKTFLIASLII